MAFKKHSPGCLCCFVEGTCTSFIHSTGIFPDSDELTTDNPTGAGSLVDPVYGGASTGLIDITTIPSLGTGAEIAGVDAENARWIVQRSNGEIWTLSHSGDDPLMLWDTTTDIAGHEVLVVKLHPSWGCAAVTSTTAAFSVDSDGNYITPPPISARAEAGVCVDSAGNIYSRSNSAPFRLLRNGTAFADAISLRSNKVFHDGTNLYAIGGLNGSTGIYQAVGVGAAPTLITSFNDIFGGDRDAGFAYWDNLHNRLRVRITNGGNFSGTYYCKMKLDGSSLVAYETGTGSTGSPNIWMSP